jgi:N-acetylglutamate synthase-like GNAT family acetyltransferase
MSNVNTTQLDILKDETNFLNHEPQTFEIKIAQNELRKVKSSTKDRCRDVEIFLVTKKDSKIIGIANLVVYNNNALLRSFEIQPEFQKRGCGTILLSNILSKAEKLGVKEIYSLTRFPSNYLRKKGFCYVNTRQVPKAIQNTKEFKINSRHNLICMRFNMVNF